MTMDKTLETEKDLVDKMLAGLPPGPRTFQRLLEHIRTVGSLSAESRQRLQTLFDAWNEDRRIMLLVAPNPCEEFARKFEELLASKDILVFEYALGRAWRWGAISSVAPHIETALGVARNHPLPWIRFLASLNSYRMTRQADDIIELAEVLVEARGGNHDPIDSEAIEVLCNDELGQIDALLAQKGERILTPPATLPTATELIRRFRPTK